MIFGVKYLSKIHGNISSLLYPVLERELNMVFLQVPPRAIFLFISGHTKRAEILPHFIGPFNNLIY